MTPIADYIASVGGWDAAHAALSARPRFKYLIQLFPTTDALRGYLETSPLQYVEQVEALVDYRNRQYSPIPFSLVYPEHILFNSNIGADAGKVPPDRPVDIDWLFQQLETSSTRINYHGDLHKSHDDFEYGLLPKADIDWIAANRPSLNRDFPGTNPLHDCEDAVAFDMGWLVAQGERNPAIGRIDAVIHAGTRMYAHVFMALVDTSRKIWFLDNADHSTTVIDPLGPLLFGHLAPTVELFNIRF